MLSELLEYIRNKGAAWQTTDLVDTSMEELKPLIEEKDYFDLHIALQHYRLGEGAIEFYTVCKRLTDKYK